MALNLVATRVDDRLIHGQGMAWLRSLPITTVVVVNDEVAKSEMEQGLMSTLIPPSVEIRYFSVQKAIDTLHKAADRQKVFLIFKSLADVDKVMDGGVPIKSVNIGNIRRKNGSTQVSPYMNLMKDEILIIKKWLKNGIRLDSKQTPAGEARKEYVDFHKLVKNK